MPVPLRCDPKLFEKDLKGQVIIVTGANSGIGFVTTAQLAKQGATVVMACRSEEKGKTAASKIGANGVYMNLDLASLQSVKNFAAAFEEKYSRLDVLINNAGVMECPLIRTKEGFENQFGCNHLGHFLLSTLLFPIMVKTAETTGTPSRFIALSSVAAAQMSMGINAAPAIIDFDDLNWEKKDYDKNVAYQQSKLANSLHALEVSKRFDPSKIIATSLHPGWVYSNLDQHILGTGIFGWILRKLFLLSGNMITPEDGAQTTLHCALNDEIENGAFYSQFGVYMEKEYKNGGWPMKLPNPNYTEENASKLWQESEKLVFA